MALIDKSKADRISRGIASYRYEQNVILRVLRRYGPICENQFDYLFGDDRQYINTDPNKGRVGDTVIERKPIKKLRFLMNGNGSTFILGGMFNTGYWTQWLELIQMMSALGKVEIYSHEGKVYYRLPE